MKVLNLGEYGYSLVFSQSRDLTGADLKIYVTKPDGEETSWDAILDGTTTFYYELQVDDIDQTGTWILWLYAKWTSPDKELWTRTSFRVKDSPLERLS
jgi:uncharacterized protein YfaS (alpha-2-macroglobulin family)